MDVSDAVHHRKSVRAFLDTPVPDETVRALLTAAARAPSGGNVQPWRMYVVNGDRMTDFLTFMEGRDFDTPEYEVYPANLWDPYRTNRFALGEAMYATMGIPREDKEARFAHLARNYRFFDAPVGMVVTIDRFLKIGSWLDLGMFLQNVMVAARGHGLHTCPQAAFAPYHDTIRAALGIPAEQVVVCGMALGHVDPDVPEHRLDTERAAVDEFCTFLEE